MKNEHLMTYDSRYMFAAYNWRGQRRLILVAETKEEARTTLRGLEKLWIVRHFIPAEKNEKLSIS
jgi:hypothetical protein